MNGLITPPNIYSTDEPVTTPYLRAKDEWDRRIGTTVVQAKNWRLISFSLVVINILLIGSNLLLVSQKKLVPVIVRVSDVTGEPEVIKNVNNQNETPKEIEIKYFLVNFIKLVRGIPSDPVIIRTNWLNAYYFLTKEASNLLNDLANREENSPLKKIGTETVIVKPLSVTQVGGSNSYQVRWGESIYSVKGVLVTEYVMTGVFTVEFNEVKTEEEMYINPLGIFINNFQWNREL